MSDMRADGGRRFPWLRPACAVAALLAASAVPEEARPPEPTIEMLLALDAFPGDLGPLPPKSGDGVKESLVQLGSVLFFDERLSPSQTVSCAFCHQPDRAWSDGAARAIGNDGEPLNRNTPTILNTGYLTKLFWDGRANSLEEQVLGPLMSQMEHGFADAGAVEAALNRIPYYADAFQREFGAPASLDNVAKAISAFERDLTTPNARFDQFITSDHEVFTDQEKRGLALFVGKASCTLCHQGPMFTDELTHNLTGEKPAGTEGDGGGSLSAIRTPGLRNVALTAPYMHDGRLATLADVVAFYNEGGSGDDGQSPLIFPLGLDSEEQEALVAFLHTLTGEIEEIAPPTEALRGAHDLNPTSEPTVNFIPSPPKKFRTFRELMSSGVHEQFSFLGFSIWQAQNLNPKARDAIAASAENLAQLAARAAKLFPRGKPEPADQAHFDIGIRDLEGISRSLAQASRHGARAELESQFQRLERSCNMCHTRFRPDLVWTGAHE